MQDKPATAKRPPLRRTAGSRAAHKLRLTRAERLLTVRDVARLLCVSRQTVYTMIRGGDLSGLRVRGMMRLRPGEVLRYMRHNGLRVERKRARREKRGQP